jgi:asparagine synthase (glutamine-hydrolysing)
MFAFAIWDASEKELFIARDRLGIKPLYYYHTDKAFIFASELKALMAFAPFERQIDCASFHLYLHYQYIPAPRTIFENTYKLEPGSSLILSNGNLAKKQWWTLPGMNSEPVLSNPMVEEDALAALEHLLIQSVSDRMISDVPIGALLSGGMDSSLVVALMQKVNRDPIKTFSIGFKEEGYNEAPWAKKIALHLGTDHTELTISSADALSVIPQLPEIYDEPFADSSSIPTFLVSKLTRDWVTVALSGDGGDEQFAGYVRYWMTETMTGWMRRLPVFLRKQMKHRLSGLPISKLSMFYSTVRPYLPQRLQVENFQDKWQKIVSQLSQTKLSELYRMTVCIWPHPEILRLTGNAPPSSSYESVFDRTHHLETLRRLMLVDQHTYLPDAMLTKVDRASMAASLEVRVPLLDHRVVAFTSQLPASLCYRHGKGKYLLGKLLSKYVPQHLIDRPKMGFGVPIAQWLKKELKELVTDYLSPAHLEREGRFDSQVVSHLIKEHMDGANNHQHRIWVLLMWEMWRERWL